MTLYSIERHFNVHYVNCLLKITKTRKNYQRYKHKKIIKFVSKPYFNILNAKPSRRFNFKKNIPILE